MMLIAFNSIKIFFLVLIFLLTGCFSQISIDADLSGSKAADSKNILDPNKIIADANTTCSSFTTKEECQNASLLGLNCEFNIICLVSEYHHELDINRKDINEMSATYFEPNNSSKTQGSEKYELAKKKYELFTILFKLKNKKNTPAIQAIRKEYDSLNQKINALDAQKKKEEESKIEQEIEQLTQFAADLKDAEPEALNKFMSDIEAGKIDIFDYRLLVKGASKDLIEGLFVRSKELGINMQNNFTSTIINSALNLYDKGISKWENIIDDAHHKNAENKNKEILNFLFCSDSELVKSEIKKMFYSSEKDSGKSNIKASFVRKLKEISKTQIELRENLIQFVANSDDAFKAELKKFANEKPYCISSDDKKFVKSLLNEASKL